MILSAGVIPVRQTPNGLRILLLRVYRYWDFPKGQLEEGETPFDAAKREVMEETGIADLEFPWGYDFHETPAYGRGKIARYYLGRTSTSSVTLGISPELGRPEHHEYRWVGKNRAFQLLNPRVSLALQWGLSNIEQPDSGLNP